MKELLPQTPLKAHGGEADDGDGLPGQPWTPEEPSPDGQAPEGDGKHRK